MITVNTEYFREAALYFKKFGRYPDGDKGSDEWRAYWKEEQRRCLEGYSVGGMYISGYHYNYINYCPIELVRETYGSVHKNKPTNARKSGERKVDFPDFWDLDLMFFHMLDIAENGISIEKYNMLPVDMNLDITDPYNLSGGHHAMWLKARGCGASFKGGSLSARNFFHIRKSKSFMLASSPEFLTKDGIFSKFLSYRDFINTHTAFAKSSDVKEDRGKMQIRASYIDPDDNIEKGYMSEVMGVALGYDYQKARGKRGKVINWEEFGKFKHADLAWNIARRSVEELDVVYGLMVGFGTGGVEGSDFESLEKIFYNPKAYNVLCFDNIWDTGMQGTNCGFFTPAYMNVQYKDHNGNSDIVTAKKKLDLELEEAKKSPDPTTVIQFKAENPYCPQDAVLNTATNIFPIAELQSWKMEVLNKHINIGIPGSVHYGVNGIDFKINMDLKPVYKFPHRKGDDVTGCVVKYQNPLKIDGKVPDNLYILCVDTYRHDTTTGDSIGAAYVIMNINNLVSHKGDLIVASYVGRPNSQEEFNKNVFLLAEYYNAKIGFENDEPGDIIGYAKRFRKLHMLAPEFQLAYDDNLKSSSVRRGFGMHIGGGGKTNNRKLQGDIYLKNWLLTPRNTNEDGIVTYNFHTIYDPALLEEFIKYSPDGNFDRVSALRIGMYHQLELLYNQIKIRQVKSSKTLFFEHRQFQ